MQALSRELVSLWFGSMARIHNRVLCGPDNAIISESLKLASNGVRIPLIGGARNGFCCLGNRVIEDRRKFSTVLSLSRFSCYTLEQLANNSATKSYDLIVLNLICVYQTNS